MRYIIVDDEHIGHDIIKEYCDLIPSMVLVDHCYDAFEAIECLKLNKVELIFLDLNMPKLKGFDFLRTLPNPPKVIVTTAYQEHAIEGYDLNIIDYLLKPFGFPRFLKAVNKVKIEVPSEIIQNSPSQELSFFVKSDRKHIQLIAKDILFVESIGNYCKLITSDQVIKVREKISDWQAKLPSDQFYRVHKSFIVAKPYIKMIEGNRIFIADHIVPIGKVYRPIINELVK